VQGTIWDTSVWNYSTSFDLAPGVGGGAVFLVADGIKMVRCAFRDHSLYLQTHFHAGGRVLQVADVVLNGVEVGYAADQFLRYKWDVTSLLKPTGNTLVVSFPTGADSRNSEQRWMACSGGWE
jgi:hypothetical protein